MERTNYSSEEKTRLVDEYRIRHERDGLTIPAFVAQKGLNEHTFSNWLYRKKEGRNLVKVGPCDAVAAAGGISIEYHGAVIRTGVADLASVLSAIRLVR